MITVGSNGYNVAKVVVGTKLVAGQSVTVGTKSDLDKLVALADAAGVARIQATVDLSGTDIEFDGAILCNLCENGIEFHTITYYSAEVTGGSPIIIGGQAYMDGTNMKVHITAVTVS